MGKNKALVLIGIPFILLCIGIIFIAIHYSFPQQPPKKILPINPTITPYSVFPSNIPPVVYKAGDIDKIVSLDSKSKTISAQDEQVRSSLIGDLGGKSGIISKTDSYVIYYRSVSDLFDTVILTTDLNTGKTDAEKWLASQGLTQDGICKLPISFFPSVNVQQKLANKNLHVVFDSSPDGC